VEASSEPTMTTSRITKTVRKASGNSSMRRSIADLNP
jgi:hypothetical protein